MSGKDYELERLRSEMDSAQKDIDTAKARLDYVNARRNGIKSEIESVKYRICDIKRSIDEEYNMMKICFQNRDKYDAENHRYNAQSYKDSLQREYEIKKSYYHELDFMKDDYEAALSVLQSAKERKQRAREAFRTRLEVVRAQNESERSKWKEKPCKECGAPIRYHVEWSRIPDLCKPCLDRNKAKWHETTCRKCGKTIRYHQDWTHIPSICKDCKSHI